MKLVKNIIPGPYSNITIYHRDGDRDDWSVIREIFNQNIYRFDGAYLESGVVMDIGANIGVFTLYVLNIAHGRGQAVHIYAVEPEQVNLDILHKNIEANPKLFEYGSKVHIAPVGISNFMGTARISNSSGSSRLTEDDGDQQIEVITYDELLKTEGLEKIDFCKIDIEGSEVPMITASSHLNSAHYYAIEFDEHNNTDQFIDIIKPFLNDFSFNTFGVPSRGCNIYLENHNWSA